ncbi:elongation factor P--(R)-beta-lysine ligase [Thalassotalea eurytherma]|uniref:Elongation factor P--(R)-beta-lysine ligase n=2 Tax=Thalassotalea eurytherma TaxID=1144278 RepID=A0ABQ6H9M0_9GAMM|nr:elongation factor P--(R)-beta-lysine ligase [Thalassotalea eurytherma]
MENDFYWFQEMEVSMWRSSMTWEDAKKRAQLVAKIRQFFQHHEVIEVDTPILSAGTVTDAHLDAFQTEYHFPSGKEPLFLQTSPEYAMKRLLASGYQSIYQICKSFRDEAFGRHHNPEFTMLEWYRVGLDHHQLMQEIDELLKCVLDSKPAELISYQNVFINNTGIDPLSCDQGELITYLRSNDKADDWLIHANCIDTLLQFIFCEFVETNIGNERPCFVFDFPISQASLSKASDSDPRVAHRFECYYKGLELANGFNELTDPDIQLKRFESDNIKRKLLGLPERPIDQRFVDGLKAGLPECSGVAVGIDRLVMLALSKANIESVLTFTIENA